MDYDDFNCPLCTIAYDEKKQTPRMLTKCGHTYCQECLQNNYFNKEDKIIRCPEDHTLHDNIEKIEDLPKNLTLINLIKKANIRRNSRTFTEQKRTSLGLLHRASIPKVGGKLYFTAQDESNYGNSSSQKEEISQTNRKSLNNFCNTYYTQNYPYTSEFSLNETNSITLGINSICHKHRRPLEIACLDHKIKVCTTCALFGEHKHHNLKSEDDIIKDITVKAECLIELYESVEKNSDIFEINLESHRKHVDEIKMNLKGENEKIREKAKMYFKELRFLLKTKEKEIVENLDEKFEMMINKKFEYVNVISKEMKNQTEEWKKE